MNLTELKKKPVAELLEMAEQMGLDNMARSRKQDHWERTIIRKRIRQL